MTKRQLSLLYVFALAISAVGCVSTNAIELDPKYRFTNVSGTPKTLISGVQTLEVRWLFIPIYSKDNAHDLEAEMLKRVQEAGGSQLHLLQGTPIELPLWAIPPYFLFPLPSRQLQLVGVGAGGKSAEPSTTTETKPRK